MAPLVYCRGILHQISTYSLLHFKIYTQDVQEGLKSEIFVKHLYTAKFFDLSVTKFKVELNLMLSLEN